MDTEGSAVLTMRRMVMGISARSSFRASRKMSSLLLMWRVSVILRVRTSKLVSFSFRVRVLPCRPSLAMSSASFSDSSAHCGQPLPVANPFLTRSPKHCSAMQ